MAPVVDETQKYVVTVEETVATYSADKYIESAHLGINETDKPAYYPTGTVRVGTVFEEWDSSSVTWNT